MIDELLWTLLEITITAAAAVIIVVAFRCLANRASSLVYLIIMAAHDTTIGIIRSADGMWLLSR